MKVEEKNKSDLKQDKNNNHQNKKNVDVAIEKDKIQDEKNKGVRRKKPQNIGRNGKSEEKI